VTTVDTVTAANTYFGSASKPSPATSVHAPASEGAATVAAVPAPARTARGDSHHGQGNPNARHQGASLVDFANLRAAQESGNAGNGDSKSATNPSGLSEAELKLVAELKARDAEVRRHEQAHANAGGQYSGQPSYSYQRGPDGGNYAVGGSTPIDVSPIAGNPDATIRKMEVVKRAAMAPAEPSGQDRAVASRAQAEESKARAEAAAQRREEAVEARTETAGQSEPGAVGSAAAAYGGEPDAEAPTLLAVA
jgi:hypothetical protein|tara:strand:+ start:2194 stop:2946 length:753 start_codon:yes stop_codon:yes gene_type:complete